MDVFEVDALAIKSLLSDTYITIKKLIFRHFHYSEASRKKKLAYLTDCEVTKIILKQI